MLTMTRAHRIAAAATVVIPLAIVVLMLRLASAPQHSGAGLKDSDRPLAFILMSLFGAVGWVLDTSIVVAIFTGPTVLPSLLRIFVMHGLLGSRSGFWPDGTPAAPAPRMLEFASTGQLLWAALFTLPAFAFLPSLLLGWLVFRPSVYWPVEAVAVAIMGVAVIAWSTWLVARVIAARAAAQG
jgi:hypothetical protein